MPVNLRSTAIVITETPDPDMGTPSRTRKSPFKPQNTPKQAQQTPKAAQRTPQAAPPTSKAINTPKQTQRTPKTAAPSSKSTQRTPKRPRQVETETEDEDETAQEEVVKTPNQTRKKKEQTEVTVTRKDLAYQLLSCARLVEDEKNAIDAEQGRKIQAMVEALMEAITNGNKKSAEPDSGRTKRQRRSAQGEDDDEEDELSIAIKPARRAAQKKQTSRSRRIIQGTVGPSSSSEDEIAPLKTPLRHGRQPRRPVESFTTLSDAEDIPPTVRRTRHRRDLIAPDPTPKTPAKPTPKLVTIRSLSSDELTGTSPPTRTPRTPRTPHTATKRTPRTHKRPLQTEEDLPEGEDTDLRFYGFGAFGRVSKKGRMNALVGADEFRVVDVGDVVGGMGEFVRGQVMAMEGVEV